MRRKDITKSERGLEMPDGQALHYGSPANRKSFLARSRVPESEELSALLSVVVNSDYTQNLRFEINYTDRPP